MPVIIRPGAAVLLGMLAVLLPTRLILVLALQTLAVAPAAAGDAPAGEFRLPPAPSAQLQESLTDALARATKGNSSVIKRYQDSVDRIRANWRVAPPDEPRFDLEAAAREAVLSTDFGDGSRRKAKKQLAARTQLALMMFAVDTHRRLRLEFGHRLALRAVMACKGDTACLDGITPTATMPSSEVASVRAQLGNDAAALADAELASAAQLEALSTMYADGLHLLVQVSGAKSTQADKEID
ncbi:MAG: hypothetical protein IPH07_37230 [Deltaproteobacteria bacterium]|nr:hypothetical protein [Deltaproteobacteria bacterium]